MGVRGPGATGPSGPCFDPARGLLAANAYAFPFANLATVDLVGRLDVAPVSSLPCFPAKQGRRAASLVSADSRADAPLPSLARISGPAAALWRR